MLIQTIGIIGGAGPMAGVLLLERIFYFSRSLYNCYKDSDFPKVCFLNVPFSDMLSPNFNVDQIQDELKTALNQLRSNGSSVLAIACNTLHIFLDDECTRDLILLPEVIKNELCDTEPLVLCTSTSVAYALHKRYFPCSYPSTSSQKQVDELIDKILKGDDSNVLKDLSDLIEAQPMNTILLGCTELSLFGKNLVSSKKTIIDPIDLLAKSILKNVFNKG
jgi:aspartate racemase